MLHSLVDSAVKKMWRKTKEKWAKILRMSKRCFTFAPAIEKMAG